MMMMMMMKEGEEEEEMGEEEVGRKRRWGRMKCNGQRYYLNSTLPRGKHLLRLRASVLRR